MRNIPLDKQDFSKPLQYDGKYLRPFFWWSSHVLPTVYDNSLSYYEVLDKIMFKLIEAFKDVNALGEDVTALHDSYIALQDEYWKFKDALLKDNDEYKDQMDKAWATFQTVIQNELDKWKKDTESDLDAYKQALTIAWDTYRNSMLTDWANYQNTINSEWTNYQSTMNKWKDDTDKKFAAEYQALIDYQTDLNKQWDEYKSNLNQWKTETDTAFNEYKTNLTQEWNTEKQSLEDWKSQSDSDIKAKLEEMTQLKSDLEQWKTETDTAFSEYKTDLTNEWNTYKTDLNREWSEYSTHLTAEWEAFEKSLTSATNVVAPWLGPETTADFSDPTKLILNREGGFDSPAIFMLGNTGNVNVTLNALYTRLNGLDHVTVAKLGTHTLEITLVSGYILCYDTTPVQGGQEINHFVVKTVKEMHDTDTAHLIPLYGQGSSGPFCGVWWVRYYGPYYTDTSIATVRADLTDLQNNYQDTATKLQNWYATQMFTIDWLIESYKWDVNQHTLTLNWPIAKFYSPSETVGFIHSVKYTIKSSGSTTLPQIYTLSMETLLTNLFGSGNYGLVTGNNTKTWVFKPKDLGNAPNYLRFNIESNSPASTPTVTTPTIATFNPHAGTYVTLWGATVAPDLEDIEADLNDFDSRITTNTETIQNQSGYTRVLTPNILSRTSDNVYTMTPGNTLDSVIFQILNRNNSGSLITISIKNFIEASTNSPDTVTIHFSDNLLYINNATSNNYVICYDLSTQRCIVTLNLSLDSTLLPLYYAPTGDYISFSGFFNDIDRRDVPDSSEALSPLSNISILNPKILNQLQPNKYQVDETLTENESLFYITKSNVSLLISALSTIPQLTVTLDSAQHTLSLSVANAPQYLIYNLDTKQPELCPPSNLNINNHIPLYYFAQAPSWSGFLTNTERFNYSKFIDIANAAQETAEAAQTAAKEAQSTANAAVQKNLQSTGTYIIPSPSIGYQYLDDDNNTVWVCPNLSWTYHHETKQTYPLLHYADAIVQTGASLQHFNITSHDLLSKLTNVTADLDTKTVTIPAANASKMAFIEYQDAYNSVLTVKENQSYGPYRLDTGDFPVFLHGTIVGVPILPKELATSIQGG